MLSSIPNLKETYLAEIDGPSKGKLPKSDIFKSKVDHT